MRVDALPELALAASSEATVAAILERTAAGLEADPDVALARVALLGDRETVPPPARAKIGRVATAGAAELVPDLARDDLVPEEWRRGERIVAFAGHPLVARGESLGALGVFLRSSIGEAGFAALGRFASEIALAIANARALEEARARHATLAKEHERLQSLLEITSSVGKELELGALHLAFGRAMQPIVGHEFTNLVLHDADEGVFRMHTVVTPAGLKTPQEVTSVPFAVPVAEGPARFVLQNRRPFVTRTQAEILEATSHPVLRSLFAKFGLSSSAAFPLVSRGRVLGFLGFGSTREAAFDEERVRMLSQVVAQIAPAVDNALAYERLEKMKEQLAKEKLYLESEIRSHFDELVGESKALRQTLAAIETVAATSSTVLVQGETGTGKELVARAIHKLSGRGERTFVKLNCAAIPTGLLESELFGHEKGAFTGAVATKVGRFELAHKGTLFLDEIGEISTELQPKLLRVLQDQEFERLGGTKTIKVDVRVIAATNRDLSQMVAAREFRSDLFYRLNVFPVPVPPLRERKGDVPLLARHFVDRFARGMGKKIETLPAETLEALERHTWPGNVRELEHLIERSVILSRGSVLEVPLGELKPGREPPRPAPLAAPAPPVAQAAPPPAAAEDDASERALILKALVDCGWRVGGAKGAAAKLGLSRTTLQSRMLRLGIVRPG
jgi:formate hydrogenlyase transcriptional activator